MSHQQICEMPRKDYVMRTPEFESKLSALSLWSSPSLLQYGVSCSLATEQNFFNK